MSWSMDEAGTLTLSGTGPMDSYASVSKIYGATAGINFMSTPWGGSATAAVIEDGVTHIGDGTFANDWNLRSLDIPDSVKAIGIYAFYDTGLTGEIVLPEGLTYLGEGVFSECSLLTTVDVPDLVTSIGDRTFYKCTALESVTLGDSIKSIGYEAFTGCTALKSIVVPEGVTSVNVRAFEGCTSLTEIKFTGNAPAFETYAFLDVTATVYYPADDATWTADVMKGYGGTITWEPYTDYIAEGVCGDNLTWKLKTSGELIISGTGAMYDYASAANSPFYKHKAVITSVQLPDGITTIGEYAFAGGYPNLDCVEIPLSVTSIREVAFGTGVDMIKLKYPGTMEQWNSILIFEYTYDCYYGAECSDGTILYKGDCGDDAKFVVFGDGTLEITGTGKMKFYQYLYYESYWSGDENIKKVVIGEGITSIAAYAFKNCKNLQTVEIAGTVTTIGAAAFYCCTGLMNIVIPDGATSIGSEAFYGCSSLASVKFGTGVANIQYSAFERCSSLSSITFTGDAPDISDRSYYGAFQGVTATAYYRAYNETWTADVMQNYGGTITWQSYVNYIAQGQCGDDLYWGLTDDGVLAITGTGNMWNYTWDGDHSTAPWYSYHAQITKIVIESGATSIGNYAFSGCNSVTKATIAEGVTSIGYNGFSNCFTMTEINLPNSLVTIGESAFEDCGALLSIHIPDAVTGIGESAFESCSDLASVTFGENSQLEILGAYAFDGCGALTGIAIAAGVTKIGDFAFQSCDALTTVTFGANSQLQRIGDSAFARCVSLTTIQLPDSLERIGSSAFNGCSGLTAMHIPDNVVAIGDCAFIFCYNITSITFGQNSKLKDIGLTAFAYCDGVSGITVPDSVTTIGDHAFSYSGFENIYFGPNSQLTSIGNYAFRESNVQSIILPEGVTSIGAHAFKDCYALAHIVMGNHVASIGENAFAGCDDLVYVILGSGVTGIGDGAFSGCTKLWHVFHKGTSAQWDAVTIGADNHCLANVLLHHDCTGDEITDLERRLCAVCVENGYIPSGKCGDNLFWTLDTDGVLTITGSGAMYDFNASDNLQPWYVYACAIQEVVIEEGATTIGEYAFFLCNNISEASIATTVTSIGKWAFASCKSLAQFTLPANLSTIGDSAFRNCDSLQEIVIPNGITAIGETVFYSCDSLAKVVLPESLRTIGKSAFGSCASLTGFVIPDGVQSIGQFAFNACRNLAFITIPASVQSIGSNVFSGCKNFWHVLYRGTEEQWASVENGDTTVTKATVHFNCTGDEVVDPVNKICTLCCVHEWADATCTAPVTCALCGMTEGEALGHSWDEGAVTQAPTCTEQGVKTYTCDACGATYTEAVAMDPEAHNWDEGTVTTPATCTAEGVMTYTCLNGCGESYTEELELDEDNHDPLSGSHYSGLGNGQHEVYCDGCESFVETEDCTFDALTHHCVYCEDPESMDVVFMVGDEVFSSTTCLYGDELAIVGMPIPDAPTGYTFGGWFTADGEKIAQGVIITDHVVAYACWDPIMYRITWELNGCTYDEILSGGLPQQLAYTEAGNPHQISFVEFHAPEGYTFVGFFDGEGNELEFDKADQLRLYLHVTGDMTVRAVVEKLSYTVTWMVDGQIYATENVLFGDPITAPMPTKSPAGCSVYTFSGWDAQIPAAMPARNLTFSGSFIEGKNHAWKDATCTTPKTCASCNATEGEALGHCFENDTCTACGGRRVFFRNTEGWETVNIFSWAVSSADWMPWPGEAMTQLEAGSDIWWGVFYADAELLIFNNNCDTQTADQIVPAADGPVMCFDYGTMKWECYYAHSYTQEISCAPATCQETGLLTLQCAYCDASKTEVLPVDPNNHAGETTTVGAVAATCGTDGYSGDAVCGCGATVQKGEVIPATGAHIQATREENRVEATCGASGSYELVTYCTVCETELQRTTQVISATGKHTVQVREENRVEATCGEDGAYDIVSYCSVCQKELDRKSKTIPATGLHSYTIEYAGSRQEPTCVATGLVTMICDGCGNMEDVVLAIDPSNHTGNNHVENAKPATCTEHGYTGDTVCECGAILDTGEQIPATGLHADADADGSCDGCGVALYIPGDADGDGAVDSDDAIYLLYYTFNPTEYPLNQDGDFDGDGNVDSDDAIYLLYYTFNPTAYPLH